ncbi:MAG TPA: NAD(P)-dependent alcohol dehydrogenase [Gammaproteobacteria bacterium]
MHHAAERSIAGRAARRVLWLAAAAVLAHAGLVASAAAETIRQYQFERDGDGYRLVLKEVDRPEAGPGEVLVRVHATSLNRRDVLMLNARYGPGGNAEGGIPLSDGAGEVIAVGPNVTRFEVGDRVAGIFFQKWIDGDRSAEINASARGGNAGGMLSEVIVSHEDALVAIPDHLTYEEAATLPCAGVTAWVGLFKHGGLEAGDFVLLEGTGGVSTLGLQLAAAAGARPIITSSSDEKLETAKLLGAFGTVNYRENPEWQRAVRELTGGAGVKHVLEVGGEDTLPRAVQALGYDGHIALIGGLSGFASSLPVGALMTLGGRVTGIYVGSRADFEALNAFIAEHEVRPYVGRVFELKDAPAAFDLMENGDFVGKIVIRL